VFAQAKAAAKKASAISNAKQINLGSIMYSNDYDDMIVPYFSYCTGAPNYYITGEQEYWPQLISPYVQKAQTQTTGSGGQEALAQDLSKIFFDPIEAFTVPTTSDPKNLYGNIASWGISDDIVNWWCAPGVPASCIPVNNSAIQSPAGALIFTETWDAFSWSNDGGVDPGYPGNALALSYFDVWSGGVYNGAQNTLQSPYNASYKKTTLAQEPDPKGQNVTAFVDGHVKSMPTAQLTHSGQYWSIGGNNQWP